MSVHEKENADVLRGDGRREFRVRAPEAGTRIDIVAAALCGITRSRARQLLERGLLTVAGSPVKPNYKTKDGDIISFAPPETVSTLVPEDLPVRILYRDDFLIVLDKPPGMVVYPAAGHPTGTLMNAVAHASAKLSSVGSPLRPGVVHRLDKDTSGVMVVALDDVAYYHLVEQFHSRTISRRYKALVLGNLKGEGGTISGKIGRSQSDRKKMSTHTKRGKEALTTWTVLERFGAATLIEARLATGRTHQIRVHFSSIGHPVLGDSTYGRKTAVQVHRRKIVFTRQMLHAETLGFTHPQTGRQMEFRSELPHDMHEILERLRELKGD